MKINISGNTATITTTWTEGANSVYSQTISVQGIRSTDTPIIDVVLDSDPVAAQSQLDAWSYISRISTSNNSITVYAVGVAPSTAIPIQILCVR